MHLGVGFGDAMLGAKRAVWLCHTSDSQQRRAPEAGEPNVHVISQRALSTTMASAVGMLVAATRSAPFSSALAKKSLASGVLQTQNKTSAVQINPLRRSSKPASNNNNSNPVGNAKTGRILCR